MSEHDEPTTHPDRPSGHSAGPASGAVLPRRNPWPGRLVPAATFLVGVVLGGLLVAAASGGDEPGAPAEPSATTDGPSPSTGATVITVPGACQQAAENLREALSLIRDGTNSVEGFRPDRIVELLDRLEDIDNETRPLLDECGDVEVSESPAPGSASTG
ncbi:hypothetical protein E8D34_07320 [Nocardioides sp. GY 10113]|uniref:hypothetical protein n=1 Tax=Nocardioides sp. GY 10113 TaxID=2569761 RepID=UPI0010A8746B|nr:hypothetical protein [Nocardioides sp. GY 10113]TIC88087.1 hypothetical protein E8D34_07320 [Nocardioides sp. GY 10113]